MKIVSGVFQVLVLLLSLYSFTIPFTGAPRNFPCWVTARLPNFFKMTEDQKLARSCCYHEALHVYLKDLGYKDLRVETSGIKNQPPFFPPQFSSVLMYSGMRSFFSRFQESVRINISSLYVSNSRAQILHTNRTGPGTTTQGWSDSRTVEHRSYISEK